MSLTPSTLRQEGCAVFPLVPGQHVCGRYEIVRHVGGVVVAARHIGLDDMVALKLLRFEPQSVERVMSDVRAGLKLRSEHAVRVLDVDLTGEQPFVATEWLQGADLRSELEQRRVFAIEQAVDCVLQACEALASAHARGVLHQQIKPENLFLSDHGHAGKRLKVLDFGLSGLSLNVDKEPAERTLAYRSPELALNSQDTDTRSDIWSLGCVLYELLTGTRAFGRDSAEATRRALLAHQPADPRELRPTIPLALNLAIARCLRKAPEQRFADVAQLAEQLSPFASSAFADYAGRCRSHLLQLGSPAQACCLVPEPVDPEGRPHTETRRRRVQTLSSYVPTQLVAARQLEPDSVVAESPSVLRARRFGWLLDFGLPLALGALALTLLYVFETPTTPRLLPASAAQAPAPAPAQISVAPPPPPQAAPEPVPPPITLEPVAATPLPPPPAAPKAIRLKPREEAKPRIDLPPPPPEPAPPVSDPDVGY